MATNHLPSIVIKIVAFYSYVTICIQWIQKMNLLTFSFIQYPLSFVTNISCNLFKATKGILITNVVYD